jgi:two-component sensor histidine kinase
VWEGIVLDVTATRAEEAKRAEAERRLELATRAAGIGIWHWDVVTGEFYYSPRARAIYGFNPDDTITYDALQRRTHPDDYAKIEPALASALDPAIRERQSYRYRITRADNTELRWLQAYGEAHFLERNGRPQAVTYTGTLEDVTEEVRAAQALQEDRARLKLALDAGHLAVWELNVKSGVVTPSTELNKLYRLPPDAHPSLDDYLRCYAPGERERVEAESAASFERGETSINFEAKHLWPDGTMKWIAVRAQIFLDEAGRPERVLGVATDATERREYQERLITTAQELQHRIKNTLSVVQTLAAQTLRPGKDQAAAIVDFNERLRALASSNDIATRPKFANGGVGDLVHELTKPYRDEDARFSIEGPEYRLSEKGAVTVGMALHELCTNAVKYGALSVPSGRVSISWTVGNGRFELTWREQDGPTVVEPKHDGFGTKLLRRGLVTPPIGEITLSFEAGGLVCLLWIATSQGPEDTGSNG